MPKRNSTGQYALERMFINSIIAAGSLAAVGLVSRIPEQGYYSSQQKPIQVQHTEIKFTEATTSSLRSQWVEELDGRISPLPQYIKDLRWVDIELPDYGVITKFEIVEPRSVQDRVVKFAGPFEILIGKNFFENPDIRTEADAYHVIFNHEIYGRGKTLDEWNFPITPKEFLGPDGKIAREIFAISCELATIGYELKVIDGKSVSPELVNAIGNNYLFNYAALLDIRREAEIDDGNALKTLRLYYFSSNLFGMGVVSGNTTDPILFDNDRKLMTPNGPVKLPDYVTEHIKDFQERKK